MYRPIKNHKSHVWLTANKKKKKNSQGHRMSVVRRRIKALSAMSFRGKADPLRGGGEGVKKLSSCSVSTGSIIGINNAVSVFFQTSGGLLLWEKVQTHKGMKSIILASIALKERQWLIALSALSFLFFSSLSLSEAAQRNLNHLAPLKTRLAVPLWVHISWREKLNTSCSRINEEAGARPCFSISARSLSPQWR